MGDYGYDDEYDETGDEGNGPRALRDADKAKAREIRDLRRQLQEASEQLATFQAQQRKASVESVLTAKGLNPKVAALIPADVEPTEAAVNAWLTEFGEVFNLAPSGGAQEEQTAGQQAALQEETDPEAARLRDAWAKVSNASDGNAPTGVDQLAAGSLQKIGETAESFDDVVKALGALPGFDVGAYRG